MLRGHATRTRLGLLLAVGTGVLLGAVFGQPGSGTAASTAKPTPKKLPTISGVAQVGETLVATRGTWSGSPTSFHFSWSRCDAAGAACLAIGGATAKIYTVTMADQGHTLRVNVTARNGSGATTATSAQTLLVPASGCPDGVGTLPVTQVAPPRRLEITSASVSPSVKRSTQTLHLHVKVTACRPTPGAGCNRLRSRDPLQPVRSDAGDDRLGRHRHADTGAAARIPRRPSPATPRGVHPRDEAG